MNNPTILYLAENELNAINALKNSIYNLFPEAEIIFFGSKARGDGDEFSDIDLLVIIKEDVNARIEDILVLKQACNYS